MEKFDVQFFFDASTETSSLKTEGLIAGESAKEVARFIARELHETGYYFVESAGGGVIAVNQTQLRYFNVRPHIVRGLPTQVRPHLKRIESM
jgi:hypothetical protein